MGLRIFYFSIVTVVGVVIQLLVSSTGSVAASLISASVVSMIVQGLWRLSDPDSQSFTHQLVPAGGALAGIVIATLIRFLQYGIHPLNWAAIPVALFTSAAAIWLRPKAHSEVCFQHRVRLTTVFECPRCRQKFCGKSDCWNSRGVRCQRCQQNEVPVFDLRNDHWWTKRFGKRVTSGSCMKCLSTAANTQVHECGQCHWQMCRRCWDLDNGQCRKCGWMPEGLPEPLRVLIAPTRAVPRRSSRTVVAGQGRQQR